MAQININDVNVNDGSSSQNSVGFFNLKNDGDEMVVRFMVDSLEDLEILTVHDINVDGKFRQISCVRDPREPIEKCPLCASKHKIKQVVFIKMIQYVPTPSGIEAQPVVWQRNASTYAFKIKGYLDNYGPLSNILCKVIRHGVHGDMKTTYDIIPNLNPTQFPQEQYPIDRTAFEGYKACGRVVLDKTVDEINTFIQTGRFPETETNNTIAASSQQEYYPQNNNVNTGSQLPPNSDTGMQRPTRYY